MPSFLSSAADGCRFPIQFGGFRDMIIAFVRLRDFEATVAIAVDVVTIGSV